MYLTFDAAMLGIQGDFATNARLAAGTGFQGIQISAGTMNQPDTLREAARVVSDLGLEWGLMPTPADFFDPDLDEASFESALETLKHWAETARSVGMRRAYNHIWPSHTTPSFEAAFDWHVRRLRRIETILKANQIQYGLEFLGPHELRIMRPYPFVHTIAGVLAIADAAGGGSGFLFDSYHWYTGSGRLDDVYLAAANQARMVCVHINDAPAHVARDDLKDLTRALPMTTGVIDSASILDVFRQFGYQGPVLCEPMRPTTERFAGIPAETAITETWTAASRAMRINTR